MTILEHHVRGGSDAVRRAWIAVALVPVGLIVALAVALAFGDTGDGSPIAGTVLALVALAAPAAAVSFAFSAFRAGERLARAPLIVGTVLLALMVVALPALVVSMAAVLIAVVLVAVATVAVAVSSRRAAPDR